MQTIYLDHAATSFPKAPGVPEAMSRYLTEVGGNPGRGSYAPATQAELAAMTLREKLCDLFDSSDPEACVFTSGATAGLNLVLKGILQPGDHALVSSMEHNAVMRPLHQLAGVQIEKVPCDTEGVMHEETLIARIRPETRMVCLTHASNVCGTLLPVEAVGEVCKARGIPFVVDAAQTAGHMPVSMEHVHASALVVPAHKGLLGPQGIGAVLMSEAFAHQVNPLITGGTGSRSDQEIQPEELPDKFEAGTQNIPGIYGFLAAVEYVSPRLNEIHTQTMRLTGRFLAGISSLPHTRLLGKTTPEGRMPVISLDFTGLDNAMVADRLAREYGIFTRCGLHCAPSAHRTLGSFPQGSVRFSIGAFNTQDEIDHTLEALQTILIDRRSFAQF